MIIQRSKIIALVLAVLITVVDQLSKNAVLQAIATEGVAKPITSYFNLVLVYNHGISFGLFNDTPVEAQPFIFLGIAAVISLVLLVWLFRTHSALIATALGMVIGGAIGNGIDRALHGAVIDFLDFYVTIDGVARHWPAFNVADSAIVCGVGLLLLDSLAFDKKTLQK